MTKTATTAILQEIFSGIQGEGPLVGARQLFVRLHGCHLACDYCDTQAGRGAPPATFSAERRAASRECEDLPNPTDVVAVLEVITRLQRGYPHHSISITGGEPLLQAPFVDELIRAARQIGLRTYLETNGALAVAMRAIAPPDYLAMDIKLPSVSGMKPLWDEHAAFLDAALESLSRSDAGLPLEERLIIKMVFAPGSLEDIRRAARLIAERRAPCMCVLQPVTPRPGGPAVPNPAFALAAQSAAAQWLPGARVIPQTHVMLGQW